MFRLTLGKIRDTIGNVLNIPSSNSRVADYINRACERLLYSGKWVQTTVRYSVCVNNGCLTWPRSIETIEAWAINSRPGTVRNGWYEFLGSGPGVLSTGGTCSGGVSGQLIDMADAVAFDDVAGTGKKLAVYCESTETTTSPIVLKFWGSTGTFVRSNYAGTQIDGEALTLPAAGAYAYTTNQCAPGGLVGVIKPITVGVVRLYEYDVATGALKPLAYYDPSEEIPIYRRSKIPGLGCSSGGTCDYCTLTVVGKLRHIPAIVDNDPLIIGHTDAIRLACQAIKKEESDLIDESVKYWALAEKCLNDQSSHWAGSGATIPLRVESGATFAMGGIPGIQ
jgi:hypothetical protein